jgi:putative oxidoreductase
MPWSPIDSNLGLFEVALVPKRCCNMAESLLLLLHFAWMGAFLKLLAVALINGFQTRLASFLIMCTMLVAIFYATN